MSSGSITTAVLRIDRRAAIPMMAGMVSTLAVLTALVLDQRVWGTIAASVVAPLGSAPDTAPLFMFQYLAGGLGVIAWGVSIVGTMLGRPWVRTFATGAFLCGLAVAAYTLLARGFGEGGFPPVWGLLLLIPCLFGGIAVALLWRQPSPGQ